jgi:hypothetical protein
MYKKQSSDSKAHTIMVLWRLIRRLTRLLRCALFALIAVKKKET